MERNTTRAQYVTSRASARSHNYLEGWHYPSITSIVVVAVHLSLKRVKRNRAHSGKLQTELTIYNKRGNSEIETDPSAGA